MDERGWREEGIIWIIEEREVRVGELVSSIYGSKVVVMKEDVEERVGVHVRETGTRGKGVDRWVVREGFQSWDQAFPC